MITFIITNGIVYFFEKIMKKCPQKRFGRVNGF